MCIRDRYGVNRINYDTPLVIVEGLNDRLACVEAGYINTVSIPGGAGDKNWIDFNFDVLEKCKEIILWFDDDKAGQDAIKECVQRLGVYRTKVVPKNDVVQAEVEAYFRKVVKNIDLDENKDYKKVDANNVLVACGPSAVIDMIASAKLEDNPPVKRLMDVEEVQLQEDVYKRQSLYNITICTTKPSISNSVRRIISGSKIVQKNTLTKSFTRFNS